MLFTLGGCYKQSSCVQALLWPFLLGIYLHVGLLAQRVRLPSLWKGCTICSPHSTSPGVSTVLCSGLGFFFFLIVYLWQWQLTRQSLPISLEGIQFHDWSLFQVSVDHGHLNPRRWDMENRTDADTADLTTESKPLAGSHIDLQHLCHHFPFCEVPRLSLAIHGP